MGEYIFYGKIENEMLTKPINNTGIGFKRKVCVFLLGSEIFGISL